MRTAVKGASIVMSIPVGDMMHNIVVPGAIYAMAKSDRQNDKSLQTFCPDEDCLGSIKHQKVCVNGHGPFESSEVLRGKVVTGDDGEDKVVILDEEEVQAVKETDIARGRLKLTPVTRESLVAGTTPWGNSYHFMPIPEDDEDVENYAIVHSVIADNPDWAFVCRANIGRGAESLLSIEAGAFGGLTLQNLAYPETLYDLPPYEVQEFGRVHKANIRETMEGQIGEFDPEKWNDRQAEAMGEAVNAASSGSRKGSKPKVKKVKPAESSLLAAISANAKAS